MEFPANLAISEGAARALSVYRPGVVRCDDDGLAFVERGKDVVEAIATGDIVSVSISSHVIGADDLVVALKNGMTWQVRVQGGARIVDALRALGVAVAS